MADEPNRIRVGYVRRAHGLRGDVILRPQSDDPDRFVVGADFITDEDPARTLTIAEIREHKEGILLRFKEVRDRNGADAMRGVTLQIAAVDRRDLDEDEFWPEDLVGLTAVDTDGTELGAVAEVITGAAQDRLVITTTDGGRIEVPFVAALVPEVNVEEGRAVLDPPPGLFD